MLFAHVAPRYDVAIHAPRAWPLYLDPPEASPGGAELQMWYLASTLAAMGFRVCHVVYEDPNLPAECDGVDLIQATAPKQNSGKSGRARDVLASLATADASVYVQRNAGSATGLVGAFAKSRRRRFVLSTSWDGDLTLDAPIGGRLARVAYWVGKRLADVIVVQTQDQLRGGKSRVRVPLHLIRSFAEPAPDAGLERTTFLWIGRVVDYKDPLAYLQLAAALPGARFCMVADATRREDPALDEELRARAAALENLELLDPRPREQLFGLYNRAVAVVNTSLVEGFPNTFMEGWARGAPALSLRLDPDRIITQDGLGRFAEGSVSRLAAEAADLWDSRGDRAVSERARAYVKREHTKEVIGLRWATLLRDLRELGRPD